MIGGRFNPRLSYHQVTKKFNSLVVKSYLNCPYNHLFRYCLKKHTSVVNLPFPVDRYPYICTLYYLRLRVHLRTFRHIITHRVYACQWRTVIAMRGFSLGGEDFQCFSPLSVPVQIVDNIAVRSVDCIKGQPA